MSEEQKHGFIFEEEIKKAHNVHQNYIPYNSRYDFEKEGIYYSVKASGSNNIEFGSALRMWTTEPFVLVLVSYVQEENYKRCYSIDEFFFDKNYLEFIRGDVSYNDIKYWHDTLISFGEGQHNEARNFSKKLRNKWACEGKIGFLKPTWKVDSKKQRRLQCFMKKEDLINNSNGLSFNPVYKGVDLSKPILSMRRMR